MTTKTKTFDCVEMKWRIQEELWSEFESRKKEFASYIDFLQAKANESPWVQQQRQRLAGKQSLIAECEQVVEELDDIRAYSKAKLESQESVPFEQAVKEIQEGHIP